MGAPFKAEVNVRVLSAEDLRVQETVIAETLKILLEAEVTRLVPSEEEIQRRVEKAIEDASR